MKHYEYYGWAKELLNGEHEPSWTDWQGLSLAEASRRAVALHNVAEEMKSWPMAMMLAYDHLGKFAQYIAEKYPPFRGK